MNTPILDFVRRYAQSDTKRLHMPGHKGQPFLGCEAMDITEIPQADSLYEANGIIAQSERNASQLFGCPTFYSTEGSSHGIRAMLYLTKMIAAAQGRTARILAARGAHQVFVSAAALMDIDVTWLPFGSSYLEAAADPDSAEQYLAGGEFTAVYVTSPNYLGAMLPIAGLAAVCRRHGALLLVDNAHGAYLRFLSPSCHPMDLGATMCCDSAHKTLPALTGAAYLHVAADAPPVCLGQAKAALSMFGSTSPSYLILQSLDRLNSELDGDYPEQLADCVARVGRLRERLNECGIACETFEPMKLTLMPKSFGYSGDELAACLRERGVECEFSDPDYVVLMPTPQNGELTFLETALCSVVRRAPIEALPPIPRVSEAVMRPHDALLAPRETVEVHKALGRVLAVPTVGCPPAVPIIMGGERVDEHALEAFHYYGISTCTVVKDQT